MPIFTTTLIFYETLINSIHLTVVYTGESEFENALAIYKQSYAQEFSIVDCLSFVVMRQNQITHAFTFDAHFAQAGFEIISV